MTSQDKLIITSMFTFIMRALLTILKGSLHRKEGSSSLTYSYEKLEDDYMGFCKAGLRDWSVGE